MNLTMEQKELIVSKNINKELVINESETLKLLNGIVASQLNQFGLPYKNCVQTNFDATKLNGQYLPEVNAIAIHPNVIGSNNFKYYRTLIHESTHLLQYFLLKNGISRKTIDDLTLDKYKKMCQKFYKDKSIEVNELMLQRFKQFVKTEPFLNNDNVKYMIQDLCKYIDSGSFYYNNVAEIMANQFAVKAIGDLVDTISVNSQQERQAKQCIDEYLEHGEKIKPEKKRLLSFVQNIMPLLKQQFRHISALSSMKLSPIVENSKELIGDIKDNFLTNVDDVRESINESYAGNNDKANHNGEYNEQKIYDNIIDKNNEYVSIADSVLDGNEIPNLTTQIDNIDIEK